MNENKLPDPDAIKQAEAFGLVFSEDKKILLRCSDDKITGGPIPDGVTRSDTLVFMAAPCEDRIKKD